jgi:isopentenyl-diphosphate delta-isomerase
MTMKIPAWVDGTLQPVDKLDVHRRGLRHPAVSVFVMNEDRVLLQRRAPGKYHTPGLWANTCCTHPGWGEDPQVCAIRRLEEELGIIGLFPVKRDRVEYRADVGAGLIEHERVDIFTAEAPADLHMDLNPEEVDEVRWVDFASLCAEVAARSAKFTPWLRIYLEQHSDAIFGARVSA